MEEYVEETEGRNPLKQVIIIGAALILIASVAKFVSDWITYPASISSVKEFFTAAADSFIFVLNFDFKVWWVFLLIIYLVARWYKKAG